jgi:hypothetical protein
LGDLRRNKNLAVMIVNFDIPVYTVSPKMSILKEDPGSVLSDFL